MGNIEKWVLRDKKSNPFNRNKSIVTRQFIVTGKSMVVNIGSNRIIDTERVLVVNDFDLISIKRLEKQYLSINVNLFDRYQRRIARIHENEWYVDRQYFWDIEYRPRHLILRNAPREITFEIEIMNNEIFVRGKLFFNGSLIDIRSNYVSIGGIRFMNMIFDSARVGIDYRV
ncbi:hypothetical protein BH18THE1_BH18THE1_16260 [soil metagenome]